MRHITRRKVVWAAMAVTTVLGGSRAIGGQDDPLVNTEPIAQVIQRTQQEKPVLAKRHQDLLTLRYDLADRPVPGVVMSAASPCRAGCGSSCPAERRGTSSPR